jgi:hypothetical protein
VTRTPEQAFEIFTARMGSWWPLEHYSVHGTQAADCAIDPRLGGQVVETSNAGERAREARDARVSGSTLLFEQRFGAACR